MRNGQDEASRSTGCLCQLAEADQTRPRGILTNLPVVHTQLFPGWFTASLQYPAHSPTDQVLRLCKGPSTVGGHQEGPGVEIEAHATFWRFLLGRGFCSCSQSGRVYLPQGWGILLKTYLHSQISERLCTQPGKQASCLGSCVWVLAQRFQSLRGPICSG